MAKKKQDFNPYVLSDAERADVAELCTTKYFETLRRLIEVTDGEGMMKLKSHATTPEMRQFYAGWCNGAAQVVLTAIQVNNTINKSN
jgi:hypothetical protein